MSARSPDFALLFLQGKCFMIQPLILPRHQGILNEILMEVIDNDNNSIKSPFSKMSEGPIYDKSKTWKIKATYSAYRGRCYTIEYTKKVK